MKLKTFKEFLNESSPTTLNVYTTTDEGFIEGRLKGEPKDEFITLAPAGHVYGDDETALPNFVVDITGEWLGITSTEDAIKLKEAGLISSYQSIDKKVSYVSDVDMIGASKLLNFNVSSSDMKILEDNIKKYKKVN